MLVTAMATLALVDLCKFLWHILALQLVLADPVFVTALLAAEPPHPTPRAHLELLLVVKLWAILVSTSYPHLTHGRVRERLKDIKMEILGADWKLQYCHFCTS